MNEQHASTLHDSEMLGNACMDIQYISLNLEITTSFVPQGCYSGNFYIAAG